ncbi:FCS-Like Zinc finger 10-like [Gastrolobium bilobum]|uniref:FCS-Like Zinc finger 10-like n=1 Tax=Gastrolobium bilobum TaxID=150636 RepID=UPI002AB1E583|nr:FCS-Like Zinc finger 10-like [Gastrolobium bilobum]XP_061346208.1 FCS-Like Zinc finger 10-like [Gastrolobium bilobum]
MLRKRSRSLQKDQHNMGHLTIPDANSENYSQSHALGHNIKSHSIFNVPCLFVGLDPKGLLDSDSVRSPTSPLDARVLSNLGNPVRNPRSSSHERHQRSWDCCKVGLSIIESLEDCSKFSGKILRSPKSKKISLSPQMMIKTPNCPTCMDSFESSKSLPKDFCKVPYTQNGSVIHKGESTVLFEIGETGLEHHLFGKTRSCSLDSCSPLKTLSGLTTSNTDSDTDNYFALKDMTIQLSSPPHFIGGSQNSNTFPPTKLDSNTVSICSSNEVIKSLSATEIELSEDYTCVISHGPNPKTTHIFGDCILETHSDVFKNHVKNEEKEKGVVTLVGNRLQTPNQYPSSDFLSFCHHCCKKLEEGKDIYIYGGEKAFCSLTCRAMEIMIDEELEESNPPSENSPKPKIGEQLFETGIITAT